MLLRTMPILGSSTQLIATKRSASSCSLAEFDCILVVEPENTDGAKCANNFPFPLGSKSPRQVAIHVIVKESILAIW